MELFVGCVVYNFMQVLDDALKGVFVGCKWSDPSFQCHFAEGFVDYGVGDVVFGREIMEKGTFGKVGLGDNIVDTDIMEAMFVNLPKGGVEN